MPFFQGKSKIHQLWKFNCRLLAKRHPKYANIHFKNADFCTASLLRIGATLPDLRALDSCVPQGKEPIDDTGYHILICKWGGGAIHRHDSITNSVFQNAILSWVSMPKELTNQFEGKQRPDIAVYDYVDGEKLWLDITIAHPFAKQYITKSFTNAGYAAAEREKAKNMKYL